MPEEEARFAAFFKQATDNDPYPFQKRLALGEQLPELIDVPTGMGKTDAVVLAWLWRRRFAGPEVREATPRRLVYCLPMRVLVEQTRDKAKKWLDKLGMLANDGAGDTHPVDGWAAGQGDKGNRIAATVLMGGEDRDEWDLYPERDAIIIGTQDMLLSRALNRGYGMSRYRWPVHFGLLNNDCLWVMDEVQLMGRGLTTSTQLQAFRNILGTMQAPAKTIWMSATLERDWLDTVDYEHFAENLDVFSLRLEDVESSRIKKKISAVKMLRPASSAIRNMKDLAKEIVQKHHPGTRTLVVLNTVRRAVELFNALKKTNPDAHLILVHSRFRPPDRKRIIEDLIKIPGGSGTIVISTQVVEAGVDISARTLFTELAPWTSLVQRFGRCNRSGEYPDGEVYWLDIPTGKKSLAPPYTDDELDQARDILLNQSQKSVGAASLPDIPLHFIHEHVIRRKDLLDMFDTTLDLAGHGLDISRFIREASETDVQVLWRDLSEEGPSEDEPDFRRDELCSVPMSDIRNLVGKGVLAWTWDPLEGNWLRIQRSSMIIPGIIVVLRAADGRYTIAEGWNPQSKEQVPAITVEKKRKESYLDDLSSFSNWQTIAEHTNAVYDVITQILGSIRLAEIWLPYLLEGVRWHDGGKAHPAFQAMIKEEVAEKARYYPVAKAPDIAWRKGRLPNKPRAGDSRRKHFRHELASAIIALHNGKPDLVAYLAAAHHGKVRMSIRSMPGEYKPSNGGRFARGIWDGDKIPEIDLGGGIRMPSSAIDLSYMELGDGKRGSSWLSRMIALRDRPDLGPFRLAYLEALVKASDERASRGGA